MNCGRYNAINPAEHIVYEQPEDGEYKIYVRYYAKHFHDGI